jgi:hypothetical protein
MHLILEVKGDLCEKVRHILEKCGRSQDYIEVSLDSPYRYNPLYNDLDAYALAYGIASLLNNAAERRAQHPGCPESKPRNRSKIPAKRRSGGNPTHSGCGANGVDAGSIVVRPGQVDARLHQIANIDVWLPIIPILLRATRYGDVGSLSKGRQNAHQQILAGV